MEPKSEVEAKPSQSEMPSNDPLLWDLALPLHALHYPLGFPVEIVTNSPAALAAAEESWGKFRKVFYEPHLQIRLGVFSGRGLVCPPPPVCRGQRNLIINIADRENYVVLDTRQGFAFGWVTPATVENRAYLRYYFLEGTACCLIDSLFLTAVHAACVALDGHGVLLCGDSGAGKSSLAYACARQGWTFLSDDSTSLVRKAAARVAIGNPYQMRFRESAVELFPELQERRRTSRLNGELAIELATASVPQIAIASQSSIDYIVWLNRREIQSPGLYRYPKNRLLQWLEQVFCWGEQEVRDAKRACLGSLLTVPVFEMRYSELASAVRQLEALVREGPSIAHESLVVAEDFENA